MYLPSSPRDSPGVHAGIPKLQPVELLNYICFSQEYDIKKASDINVRYHEWDREVKQGMKYIALTN